MRLLFAAYCSGQSSGQALTGVYKRDRMALHVTHDQKASGSVLIVLHRYLSLIDGKRVLAL